MDAIDLEKQEEKKFIVDDRCGTEVFQVLPLQALLLALCVAWSTCWGLTSYGEMERRGATCCG